MVTLSSRSLGPITASLVILAALLAGTPATAQFIPGSASISGDIGAGFYIGEFNSLDRSGAFDPAPGFDGGLGIRYQIAPNFAILGTVGIMRLAYVVDNDLRLTYGSNFFGPLTNTTYPGSTVELTKQNYIDVTRYVLFAQSHLNVSSKLVPYFTLGLGMIDFKVTNGLGKELPRTLTGDYSNQSLVMPLGVGLQYQIADRLALNAQGLFYVNATDYLDGYAHFLDFEETPGIPGAGTVATPPDYPLTFSIGATYAFYVPEEEPVAMAEPAPAPEPEPVYQPAQPAPTPAEPVREPEVIPAPEPARPQPEPAAAAPTTLPEGDRDGDGLADADETSRFMTNPDNPDTDGDGLNDYEEIFTNDTSPNNRDTDRDGLSDGDEVRTYRTLPLDPDTDDDLLTDGDEVSGTRTGSHYAVAGATPISDAVMAARIPTDPRDPDTDDDGVPDGLDACPTQPGEPRLHGCPAPGVAAVEAPAPPAPPTDYRADFDGITFRPNTDDFDLQAPGTMRDLRQLLSLMQQCNEMGVLIEGHSSAEGDPATNQALSAKRARRVYDWLLANGVAREKLLGAVGYGSKMPRVSEPDLRGLKPSELEGIRSLNRRITILVRRPCR